MLGAHPRLERSSSRWSIRVVQRVVVLRVVELHGGTTYNAVLKTHVYTTVRDSAYSAVLRCPTHTSERSNRNPHWPDSEMRKLFGFLLSRGESADAHQAKSNLCAFALS